jgi:hypothetical protein
MKLPEIKSPLFQITIPSTKKEISFRPFLVKEEKILLMAQQSGDEADIYRALLQIINNCSTEALSNLTQFDCEYIFLKLRANSVNNIIDFIYTDPVTEEKVDLKLNLKDVEVSTQDDIDFNVVILEDPLLGLKLKYPTINEIIAIKSESSSEDTLTKIIMACIDDVYEADDLHQFKDYPEAERIKFIDSMTVPALEKIQTFISKIPSLSHEIKFEKKDGSKESIKLEGLKDFFTWQ